MQKIIGNVLNDVNPGSDEERAEKMAQGVNELDLVAYDYTIPMIIFSSFGVLAFILSIWLKREDRKKGYGLELPNVVKK